ncbi:hypothetical protein ZWY2020_009993 [Hordeum vulgare]|nr:hypothetical protein ZWY2020_009993 [Hordeum vulgare]
MSLTMATREESDRTQEIDDIVELNIVEDLDNRPSEKAKNSESRVLEPKPMSPTMLASSPNSECFESSVSESDNQIDRDPLPSPPSPSNSTLSHVLPLHDVKEPDSNEEIKVVQKYDYLPQDYTFTDYDLCAHITIESSLRKQELLQIDGKMHYPTQLHRK